MPPLITVGDPRTQTPSPRADLCHNHSTAAVSFHKAVHAATTSRSPQRGFISYHRGKPNPQSLCRRFAQPPTSILSPDLCPSPKPSLQKREEKKDGTRARERRRIRKQRKEEERNRREGMVQKKKKKKKKAEEDERMETEK
ncbi:hypothetical protein M0R45_035992 [Rubus argutus]|uniref:Uncharacterized protein n=1 Tax=Rubus argutus TaxID=59490 RepID=A0AAW1VUR5_RUBAR